MITIDTKSSCCGCTACESICPRNAITMTPDAMGFLYPCVDPSLCVECGLCEKVCQFHDNYLRYDNYDAPEVFGCRHRDEAELAYSQSGAAAWAIMQAFLKEPGVVYGVGYDTVTHIVHKRAISVEQCREFRRSKYVQSDLRGIFPQVLNDLKNLKRVLFFGTPCQVAGLKSYIPNYLHDKLITIDIVCHATPSPAVWKSYVDYLERKHKKRIIKVDFRDQSFGWHSHEESFVFSNGAKISSHVFRYLFYKHLIIRDSCSQCYYTNFKRVSDITLSDFWGWEKYYKEWNDDKGVSVLMINSDKGRRIQQQLVSYLKFIQSDMSKCIQAQLLHPAELHDDFADVSRLFTQKGFEGIARKYGLIQGHIYYKKMIINTMRKIRNFLLRR